MKNIKSVLASFVLLFMAGLLVTFVTKNIISHKREELYSYQNGTDIAMPTASGSASNTTENVQHGPMTNIMTKEKYLEPIRAEEEVISDLWSSISDENSAMKVVLYEKNYWDNQLDKIFKMWYELHTFESNDDIKQEEASFVAERESRSQDAAKYAGETFNGLQYSKEYARLTKEKTYELIDRYFAEE